MNDEEAPREGVMVESVVRNPRDEAAAFVPEGYEARVLEPSPPANEDPDWFADDPTDPGEPGGMLVTPIPGEGTTWEELVSAHPDLAGFVEEHWLDGRRRLTPLPDGYDRTRRSLHQIAFFAVAPARYAVTGKLGLRFTARGFGTPFFGNDEQIRAEGGRLVYQEGDQVRTVDVANLDEACAFCGVPYREVWFEDFHDQLAPIGPAAPLEIATDAARTVGDWFGFATLVLERARRLAGAEDVSRVQLWPEHFDSAVEMGSNERGERASYGASPGDDTHPEPYLYVAAWGEIDRDDPYWNDTTFNGASFSYKAILESDDQVETAIEFFRGGLERLAAKT